MRNEAYLIFLASRWRILQMAAKSKSMACHLELYWLEALVARHAAPYARPWRVIGAQYIQSGRRASAHGKWRVVWRRKHERQKMPSKEIFGD